MKIKVFLPECPLGFRREVSLSGLDEENVSNRFVYLLGKKNLYECNGKCGWSIREWADKNSFLFFPSSVVDWLY